MKKGYNFFRICVVASFGLAFSFACGLREIGDIVRPDNTPTPIVLTCVINGTPVVTPTITPTRTPFATPTVTPTPLPTATSTQRTPVPIDPSVVCSMTSSQGIYKQVKDAILTYKSLHPERFTGNTLGSKYWYDYYFEVTDILNERGSTEAVVDDCGGSGVCGEIAVKNYGVKKGTGFHEQFNILTSWGELRCINSPDCYRATCKPSGF